MPIAVTGTKAMVTSPHYLATAAGARVLERGGNAFDAAVAVSACLGVVYPHMTGLGGDAFWMTYAADEGEVRVYNATGRSGSEVHRGRFAGEIAIPFRGPRSAITVPGMVDGWDAVSRRYGRLPWGELLEDAIAYAEDGFPMTENQRAHTAACRAMFGAHAEAGRIYMPGGEVPATGSRFVQADLAQSLRLIAEGGAEVFYRGRLAEEIIAVLANAGGYMTLEDYAGHRGEWTKPVTGMYLGHEICQAPPNSQGFAAIIALHVWERMKQGGAVEPESFAYYHLLIESLKLAFESRNAHLTDPAFASIPLELLLSGGYANELAGRLDRSRALPLGSAPMGSDTAYAAVMDEEGNAVSFIQSLYFEFGSGFVADGTGILLQNRGSFFSLDQAHVNTLEPNKRTFHTLMPAMALRDGKPVILFGAQGGEGQPQTQAAILTRMLDYGMHPQEAINAPRWLWGKTWGEEVRGLRVENRVGEAVIAQLAAAGHDVRVVESFHQAMGHAQAIRVTAEGFLQGGADPRGDGAAIGW